MSCYFLETTAFAKLFVQEQGTDALIRLMEAIEDNRKLISASTPLEIYSAVRRRERAGAISPEDATSALEILRTEAARRGIEPHRLVFAKRLPVDEHLARQGLADLLLDTLPYNAHTTASDALWAGLPVLTRTGETFASRVAASLLRAVGLPELITTTESEYEELAVNLAHDPQRLHAFRQHLQQNHLTAPLFDCKTYTRHLESAYGTIVERYHAGLPPDHIDIPRLPSRP